MSARRERGKEVPDLKSPVNGWVIPQHNTFDIGTYLAQSRAVPPPFDTDLEAPRAPNASDMPESAHRETPTSSDSRAAMMASRPAAAC